MKITACKSSKTVKIDDYTAISIICALSEAIDFNKNCGFDATAEHLEEIQNALRKAYATINPKAFSKN